MHRDFAKWFFFVFVMGSLVPGAGCWSGNDGDEGRICASPKEGGTYCVDSSDGPGAASRSGHLLKFVGWVNRK
jgi:hypothetical protein